MNKVIFYLRTSADGLTNYYTSQYYKTSTTSNSLGEPIGLLEPKGDRRNMPADAPKSFLVPRDADIDAYDDTMVLAQTEDGEYTLEPVQAQDCAPIPGQELL